MKYGITKSFTYESEILLDAESQCRVFEIEISISCRSQDGDDLEWDFESIFDVSNNQEYGLDSFSPADKKNIETRAQDLAEDQAGNAYQDYMESLGDKIYDEYKDGLYGRE